MCRPFLALWVLALVLPVGAGASTLSRSGNTLVYTAAPGETNDVTITVTPDQCDVRDANIFPITTEAGLESCGYAGPNPGISDVSVELGDGNDRYDGLGTTVPETINGGDGDDKIYAANATMHGGPGNDQLTGADPPDVFDGGAGDDLLSFRAGDTIDCSGGGNDRAPAGDLMPPSVLDPTVQGPDAGVKFVNCGGGPSVTARIPRTKIRSFLSGRFNITLSCDKPCAITWAMVGANRATKRRVHTVCDCMARHYFSHNGDGTLALAPPGPQTSAVQILGTATKKALRKARSLKIRLNVIAQDSLGRQGQVSKVFTAKR